MGEKLKVIALISGGKDSLFSILHCMANGHDVVALANLHPPLNPKSRQGALAETEIEELDSYMYQTVGHAVVPLYEQALQIPLYREEITGWASNQDKDYYPYDAHKLDSADEAECLVPLLRQIMADHPEATAISTGAILSTYQRTRVESVAVRLNLTPLSYLWQYTSLPPYTQTSLLVDMRNVGQKSRIVKVASGGLDERFLWVDVSDPQILQRLLSAMGRFGLENGSVLGEGGEFETLALDGPRPLWKGRIMVEDHQIIQAQGESAYIHVFGASVVSKDDQCTVDNDVRIPGIFDTEFYQVLADLENVSSSPGEHKGPSSPRSAIWPGEAYSHHQLIGNNLILSNIHGTPENSPEEQLREVLKLVNESMERYKSRPTIVSSMFLLRSMADFTVLNPIYGTLFNHPNPASRVTVAVGDGLPRGIHVMLSLVLSTHIQRLHGLHVQSRSYWAPANIGPYSQAISVPISSPNQQNGSEEIPGPDVNIAGAAEFVYVAGQIPLVPASMELITCNNIVKAGSAPPLGTHAEFKLQSVLALQHLWRVGRAMQVDCWSGAVAFISDCELDTANSRKEISQQAWHAIHRAPLASEHEDTDTTSDLDPWDIRNNPIASSYHDDTPRSALPNYARITNRTPNHMKLPPCYVIQVDQLPRAADIEWVSTGFANCQVQVAIENTFGLALAIVRGEDTSTSIIWVAIHEDDEFARVEDAIRSLWFWNERTNYQIVVYATEGLPLDWSSRCQPLIIPCRKVWAPTGSRCKAAVMIRCLTT